jgi:hypothetical protein
VARPLEEALKQLMKNDLHQAQQILGNLVEAILGEERFAATPLEEIRHHLVLVGYFIHARNYEAASYINRQVSKLLTVLEQNKNYTTHEEDFMALATDIEALNQALKDNETTVVDAAYNTLVEWGQKMKGWSQSLGKKPKERRLT